MDFILMKVRPRVRYAQLGSNVHLQIRTRKLNAFLAFSALKDKETVLNAQLATTAHLLLDTLLRAPLELILKQETQAALPAPLAAFALTKPKKLL